MTVWYHGRTVKNKEFNTAHTGKGKDQDGPGFYFTKNKDLARGYAYPSGIVITANLSPRKLVPHNKQVKRSEVKALLNKAPDLSYVLENWDEDPKVAISKAISAISEKDSKDAFETIWFDFYRDHPAEYLKQIVALGYDGQLATVSSEIMVVFNPKIIEVLNVEDYTPEEGKRLAESTLAKAGIAVVSGKVRTRDFGAAVEVLSKLL